MNPLLSEYNNKFNIAPFEEIKPEHFIPAFDEAFARNEAEVNLIVSNSKAPTFTNTIEALEQSGHLLSVVSSVFQNLLSANTNEQLQDIAKKVAPKLSSHSDNIKLNKDLYHRIKEVYAQKYNLSLTEEQEQLLEKTYKSFVRSGADLNDTDKEKLRSINKRLSVLTLTFGDNVLAETNQFELLIDNDADLAGLPQSSIDAAAETAAQKGYEGKWVFTIHKPSLIPFLQYSDKRTLREQMFKAYINKGDHNNEFDNKAIITEMIDLRIQKAHLLGYETHADYILEKNMAKTPAHVFERLNMLWEPAINMAKKESDELQKIIDAEGGDFKLEAWDWWYYTEKLRKEKYDLDDELLRPYFELETVKKGLFDIANSLYGIKFNELKGVPLPHKDAIAYEVCEADGSHIGVLFQDFYPRESKRGGAWMSSYRKQYKDKGENVPPVITMVMNFTKPTADNPSLLTFEELETMYHEFGHALHGLLSDCTYESLSGTAVSRDFVELPSQIMENWASEPEVLKQYARHYQTGASIPDELINKIQLSSGFNQGFATTEYLAASYLDMEWHTLTKATDFNVNKFEEKVLGEKGLIPEIVTRYRSTYFQHIFAGGYSSGYYSYIWAEMLDADAFQAFKESGDIFDSDVATTFRKSILERGGTADEMQLYTRFRGKEPAIEPLLKRKGFL